MTRNIEKHHFPWLGLSGISIAVISGLLLLSTAGAFDPGILFGNISPGLAATLICVSGMFAFRVLSRSAGMVVWDPRRFRSGVRIALLLVLPFAAGVTIVDVVYSFPTDINVPLPAALVFYPAIGYIAQLALHVIPFAMMLGAGRLCFKTSLPRWWISTAIVVVSTLEAWFQTKAAVNSSGGSLLVTYVAMSLFLFGVAELWLFRRFDYATMYAFRMLYYGYWHLAWGALRL